MTALAFLLAAGLSLGSGQTPTAPSPDRKTEDIAQAYFLFLQGLTFDGDGNSDGAMAAYRKALELEPDAADVHAELATLYARAGNADGSLTEALAALKSDPANRTAHRVMGFIQSALAESATDDARRSNLDTEAIGHFERVLAGGPADLAVELMLSRLYVRTDQPKKAIPTLLTFLDQRPDYPDAVLLLADAYEATHQLTDAIGVVEALVLNQPADTESRARLAGLYEQAGRWKDAAASWGELAQRNPQTPSYRTRQAAALADGGEFDASREILAGLAKDTPNDVSIWYLLSQVERRAGHGAAAEDAARHIAGIDPADPRGPLALGEAKLSSRDFPGAIAALEPLVTGAKDADIASGVFAQAVGQLALAEQGAGRDDQAVRTLEDARLRSPDDVDVALSLASAYEHQKNLDKAEATFREIIAKNTSNAEALNDLGYMLADHGEKLDEAVGLIQRALVVDPDNPSFLDSLGWADVKRGKPDDGRLSLERAARALPKTSVILDHLGDAYFQLKRYADAASAWDRALSGDLDGVDIAAITKKRDRARQLAGK